MLMMEIVQNNSRVEGQSVDRGPTGRVSIKYGDKNKRGHNFKTGTATSMEFAATERKSSVHYMCVI